MQPRHRRSSCNSCQEAQVTLEVEQKRNFAELNEDLQLKNLLLGPEATALFGLCHRSQMGPNALFAG